MDVTVKLRVYVTFGIILLLMAVVGVFSLYSMNNVNNIVLDITKVQVPGLDCAQRISTQELNYRVMQYQRHCRLGAAKIGGRRGNEGSAEQDGRAFARVREPGRAGKQADI